MCLSVIESSQYPAFDTPCRMPKMSNARNSERRCIRIPPYSAPTIVASSPSVLLTTPTSPASNPTPRIKKVVVRLMAKASPSLYSTMSSRISQALLRPKKSRSGAATACSSVLGTGMASVGSGANRVAIMQGISSAAISQYMPCQPSQRSAIHRASPPETSIPNRYPSTLIAAPVPRSSAGNTSVFQASKTISCDAEQKAITTASAAIQRNCVPGSRKPIAAIEINNSTWVASSQPRRRPKNGGV